MFSRGKFSRRMHQARVARVSPLVAHLAEELKGASTGGKPLLVLATGNSIVNLPNNNAWIGYHALLKVAKLVVDKRHALPQGSSASIKTATIYGELTAIHAYTEAEINPDAVMQSRRTIESLLPSITPDNQAITALQNFLIARLRNAPMVTIPKHEFAYSLGFDEASFTKATYPEQKKIWFESRANVILQSGLFKDEWSQDWKNTFNNLKDPDNNAHHELPNTPPAAPADNLPDAWKNLGTDLQLAFLECTGYQDNNTRRQEIVSATLIYIVNLVKGDTMTDAWLDKFVERVNRIAINLDLSNSVTMDNIQQYARLYPRDNYNVDQLYSALVAIYNILDENDLGPIRWILEQTAAQHITAALSLADALTKVRFVPWKLLMEEIGMDQFKNVATLVGNILYDRFGSLINPPVPTAEYPDLAYIGTFIVQKEQGRNRSNKYAGAFGTRTNRSTAELNVICAALTEFNSALTSESLSLEKVAKTVFQNEMVLTIQGEIFTVPQSKAPERLEGESVEQWNQRLLQHNEQAEAQSRLERSAWPRGARNLPQGSRLRTASDIVEAYNKSVPETGAAMKSLLSKLITVARQEQLEIFSLTRDNVSQRRKKLDEATLRELTTMEVTIPDEWRNDPAPIPAILPVENTDLKNFYVLHRGNLGNE